MENYTHQQKWVIETPQKRYAMLQHELTPEDFPRTFFDECVIAFGSFEAAVCAAGLSK